LFADTNPAMTDLRTDDCGAGTKRCQERSGDAARAFIGHVGETIRDAEDEDETESR